MEDGSDRILLIDSSEADYVFIHSLLGLSERNGYQLYRAATYEQAIACIQAEVWHMIFVDQYVSDDKHLADHFGLEIAHYARLWDDCVPIVLLSDIYSDHMDYKARKLGVFDCIEKGFLTLAYLETLLMNCQKNRQEKSKRNTWALLQSLIQPAS